MGQGNADQAMEDGAVDLSGDESDQDQNMEAMLQITNKGCRLGLARQGGEAGVNGGGDGGGRWRRLGGRGSRWREGEEVAWGLGALPVVGDGGGAHQPGRRS